jgi:hypothetical protein
VRAPPRVLAVVSRFKWTHIDYLHALGREVELHVAWSGAGHAEAVERGAREGLRLATLGDVDEVGLDEVRAQLAAVVEEVEPDVVHVMYYHHEKLVLLARELVGDTAVVVMETRDPLTALTRSGRGSAPSELEGAALRASDGQILLTRAVRSYLELAHGLVLEPTSLIVPHAFARSTMGIPGEKLSARDGRVHIALVGTAADQPGYGRWYGDIIRRLVAQGFVVHSRFHEDGVSLERYRLLAEELPDYHLEPTVSFRAGTVLSDLTSRYDLMGVFHELEAEKGNEALILAIGLTTKAVSGWFHGAIPVVTLRHYRAIAEVIEEHGVGFVADSIDDVARVASDRAAIDRATRACLALRDRFTHEHQVVRIAQFYRSLVPRAAVTAAGASEPAPR